MPRPRNPRPTYRLHKQSGQAIITITDGTGKRRDMLLGSYGSAQSKIEYDRIVAELAAKAPKEITRPTRSLERGLTVNELILRFWRHAEEHYRHPDGTTTSELYVYRRAVKELRQMYGDTPASEFGPMALKSVRAKMIESPLARDDRKTLSRRTVNAFVVRIRSVFRWGVSEELVPAAVVTALETVDGLKLGRTTARETEPVRPVHDAHVDGTLDYVTSYVRAMVQLQRLTGARPAEICRMLATDLDTAGDVWLYTVRRHKTAWRGQARVIPIGPRGQVVIKPFLRTDLTGYLFSPAGAQFTREAYTRAIARGVDKANAAREEKARRQGRELAAHELIPHWSPNQLRHSLATDVRRRYGVELAGTMLGHADLDTTAIYAEADLQKAIGVARQIG